MQRIKPGQLRATAHNWLKYEVSEYLPIALSILYDVHFLHLHADEIVEDEVGVELDASHWVGHFVMDVFDREQAIVR